VYALSAFSLVVVPLPKYRSVPTRRSSKSNRKL
jgi:hypothetical protein